MSLAGTRLGRFRITRLIGKGGTGEVYAARDEDLDREVAVKVLSSVVDVEPHRRRFLREARLAARLNHPNIASIHEVGDSDGRRYIVMELLEGRTLRALMNERRLTTDESLSIARDVARALARAHAGDVTHRDVKPENIFITTPAPGVMLAKVLDFGLAHDELTRRRTDDEDTATDLTGPGEACGTAGYLAPEQARGAAVDVRADVFSCGAVLYEMLTGERAFDGRNQLARMLAVVKQEPEALRSRLPDVCPEVEELVERCLAKDPAARYADGSELLAALEQALRTSLMSSSPELPVSESAPRPPASGPSAAAAAPGGPARSVSAETPAPSTRGEHAPSLDARAPLQRRWPMFAAAGVAVAALAVVASPWRGWRGAGEAAPSSQTMVRAPEYALSGGIPAPRDAAGTGARPTAPHAEPAALAPERSGDATASASSASAGPASASSASAGPASASSGFSPASGATVRAGATRDGAVPGAAGRAASHASAGRGGARVDRRGPAPSSSAPATSAPAIVPVGVRSPPAEGPSTGTIRFPALDVMTVIVDGEHHRLRGRTLTIPCGRHRVRAGLNVERTVDVPCGGAILF
ncbi:MAG: protein kinase [Labilithrix sp.]|nr:protein kinase [Labilithrix sp.]